MRGHAKKLVAIVGALAAFSIGPASASGAPVVDGVFPVKGLEINNKIATGPDGNVWVTLGAGKDVARITPAGQVQEFDLDGVENARGIAPGPDGNLWVVSTNEVTKFAPPDPEGTDQTFTVNTINNEGQIATGPDGLMWVASNESLIHFNVLNPPGTAQSVPVAGVFSPKDIDAAGSVIAVADFGSTRVATFTTAGTQQDFALAGGPQGVASGPAGQIAFSQQGTQPEEVGLINPPNPAQGTAIDGDPFGVALGPDDAYWIARSAAGQLIRQTTSGQVTTLGGFPAKYFPRQLTGGPGNTLWVTMEIPGENISAVARVSGVEKAVAPPPPPPPPTPQTRIDKGPKKVVKTKKKKAKVKFRFSSSAPGATFQCWLTRSSKKSRSAVLRFKACKSPKTYRLRPGKYQFSVRAVVGGVPDPTPATRKFKVKRIR